MVQTVPATWVAAVGGRRLKSPIPFPKFLALLVKILGSEAKILGGKTKILR